MTIELKRYRRYLHLFHSTVADWLLFKCNKRRGHSVEISLVWYNDRCVIVSFASPHSQLHFQRLRARKFDSFIQLVILLGNEEVLTLMSFPSLLFPNVRINKQTDKSVDDGRFSVSKSIQRTKNKRRTSSGSSHFFRSIFRAIILMKGKERPVRWYRPRWYSAGSERTRRWMICGKSSLRI